MLKFATVDASLAIGLGARIGSLTPGKDADIIAVRAEDVTNMPLDNAVATIVQGTDSGNVDTVIVAGEIRKWRGRLIGVNVRQVRRLVHDSREYIASKAGLVVDPMAARGKDELVFDHIRGRLGDMSRD